MKSPCIPRGCDFPAAHSMDSTWFAVDDDGQVAVFETGEGGALPKSSRFPSAGEAAEANVLEVGDLAAALLQLRAEQDPELAARMLSPAPQLHSRLSRAWQFEHEDSVRLLAALGAHFYEVNDCWAGPYFAASEVSEPIVVAALPLAMQRQLAKARLPVRFSVAPLVAPGDHVDIEAWGKWWVDTKGVVHHIERFPLSEEERAAAEEMLGVEAADSGHRNRLPALQRARFLALVDHWIHRAAAENPQVTDHPKPGVLGWLRGLLGS